MTVTSTYRDGLTPPAARARLSAMEASRGDVRMLKCVLGDARIWEVFYSLLSTSDPEMQALFPPIPPETLRRIVSDWQTEMFLWTGFVDVETFMGIADEHLPRMTADHRPRILDFGGGCARLSRFLDVDGAPWDAELCDVNDRMVTWCDRHLHHVRSFRNEALPPLARESGSYDLVLSLSVFTHLDMDGITAWLAELCRIVKPGGLAIVTTHGTRVLDTLKHHADLREWFRMTPTVVEAVRARFDDGGFAFVPYEPDVLETARAGASYGTTFLSPQRFAALVEPSGFEWVEFRPAGLRGWQDIVVLRRR